MKEYIEREALKAKKVYSEERHEYIVPVAEIDWMPVADVVERVRGEWVSREGYEECNVCHTKAMFDHNFCPNCGSDMRGEE